jgi:hypothetical protein
MGEKKTAETRVVLKIGDQLVTVTTISEVDEGARVQAADVIEKGAAGLENVADCAGEWTRGTANLPVPPYQMCVVGATDAKDAMRRAKKCRNDVTTAHYWTPAVLICAPYIRCVAS